MNPSEGGWAGWGRGDAGSGGRETPRIFGTGPGNQSTSTTGSAMTSGNMQLGGFVWDGGMASHGIGQLGIVTAAPSTFGGFSGWVGGMPPVGSGWIESMTHFGGGPGAGVFSSGFRAPSPVGMAPANTPASSICSANYADFFCRCQNCSRVYGLRAVGPSPHRARGHCHRRPVSSPVTQGGVHIRCETSTNYFFPGPGRYTSVVSGPPAVVGSHRASPVVSPFVSSLGSSSSSSSQRSDLSEEPFRFGDGTRAPFTQRSPSCFRRYRSPVPEFSSQASTSTMTPPVASSQASNNGTFGGNAFTQGQQSQQYATDLDEIMTVVVDEAEDTDDQVTLPPTPTPHIN